MKHAVRFTVKAKAFRSFRDEVNFEIRPLTLLYGFNQAGKSTLLRLLSLLSASLKPDAGPLDLRCPAAGGASLKEMSWLGRSPVFSPKISIETSLPSRSKLTMQLADDGGMIVNRIKIFNEEREVFSADYQRKIGNGKTANYIWTLDGKESDGNLTFNTLLPAGLPALADDIIKEIKSAINPLERLQWLQANRLSKQEHDRPSLCCCPDGCDLPDLLRGNDGHNVIKDISDWLAKQEGLGNGISLRPDSKGHWEFVHSAEGREELPLRLAGEGIRSLLPVMLCAFWAESGSSSAPSMLAVEEIEAHLHPTVQVALFDRLIKTVGAGIPIVLETHSVYLLRAMQLAVLDGRLPADDISLYWMEQAKDSAASARRIEIKEDARLIGWRPDIFEKEQELAHKIFDLRWKGSKER